MTTLWLIRHGETDWNIQRRFQGISDEPLNATGREQAAALAPRLKAMKFDAIYASDLIRVQETARLALNGDVEALQLDERLREISFGTWEGMKWEEIRQQYPDEFQSWFADRSSNPHGGDKLADVIHRIEAFAQDIREQHQKGDQILVFAHGGTLAILIALLLDADPTRWWQFRLENCTLNEVILATYGNALARLNDALHLHSVSFD